MEDGGSWFGALGQTQAIPFTDLKGGTINENSSTKASELETLQKQYVEKLAMKQELKRQKETLEAQKADTEGKMQTFQKLNEKYIRLRDEYNALLGDRSGAEKE